MDTTPIALKLASMGYENVKVLALRDDNLELPIGFRCSFHVQGEEHHLLLRVTEAGMPSEATPIPDEWAADPELMAANLR
jgi:hypothetical protein